MICPKCNRNQFEDFEIRGAKFKICTKCGTAIQIQQSDEYDNFCKEQQSIREQESSNDQLIVECPYCHSIDTKKITTTSKVVHTALIGIFSISRNSKNFHCNKCNSDF